MKTALLLFFTLVSAVATANASQTPNISQSCEEGVGNLYNPEPYIKIEGNVDPRYVGTLEEYAKKNLVVSVNEQGHWYTIDARDYDATVSSKRHQTVLTINVAGKSYVIYTNGPSLESIISVTLDGKIVGSGICWGHQPYL